MSFWTDEKITEMRRLWEREGLSASQIAVKIGAVSRLAVIGKIHRLGLQGPATVAHKRIRLIQKPSMIDVKIDSCIFRLGTEKPHATIYEIAEAVGVTDEALPEMIRKCLMLWPSREVGGENDYSQMAVKEMRAMLKVAA